MVGATSSSPVWYFAEGYTGNGFDQWLTIQNPNPHSTTVTIVYMVRGGGNQTQTINIGANTRETISVNEVIGANKEVSMKVEASRPIIAERPIYFNYQGKWQGGHDVVGYVY